MQFITSLINLIPEYKEIKFKSFIEFENQDKHFINDIKKSFIKCLFIQSSMNDYIDINIEHKDVFTFLYNDLIFDTIKDSENTIVKINNSIDNINLLKKIYLALSKKKDKSILIINFKLTNEEISDVFQNYNHILKIHNYIVVYM
jgi:hypothetical protein